jgi:superfamily II DNA or RNA helicase
MNDGSKTEVEEAKILEGDILEGNYWPEPVRVVAIKVLGHLVQIESRGVNTRTAHSNLIPLQELLQKVKITRPSGVRFSGEPVHFQFAIEALRIRLAHEFDPHFAVSVSQIDPLPHQLEAVYHYMLPRPKIRFLLADDPGAGKTIMAGLVLKELKLRGLVERVLVVTPANLTDQWRREMKERFNEVFQVVRRTTLDELYGRNVWTENSQCITSIDFAKREEVLPTLQEARWDLAVVDEAHKMAAYIYGEDVKKTGRYRFGDLLSERCDHFLLLTATPHKGDPDNFRLLMRLLDKEMFDSPQGFTLALSNKDMPLFIRRIKEEMVDFNGHPVFLDRHVKTAAFTLSPTERKLYDAVTEYVEKQSERAAAMGERGRLLGFTLALLQRRLASSTRAIRRSLERRHKRLSSLQEHLEELGERLELPEDFFELPEEEQWQIEEKLERFTVAETKEELKWECNELAKLIELAKEGEKAEEETKLLRLKELLTEQGFFDSTKKLLVFTEHRDTLDYLIEKFRKWGFKVTQIHGQMRLGDAVTPGTRLYAEKEFKDPEGAQIMAATEAAGEGINLQFCWVMVNYDIPWNPNRLEQRMGRIHRYGQTKDVIIFNMVAEDTREGDVMKRLLEKMDEIRKVLGTDKVYDVISEVIPGARLDQLFREALAKQRTWEDVKDYVEKSFSPEKVKRALEEATTLGLATQHIDLASLQAESIRAKEQRLMPEYVEKFFMEVFQALGGRVERRSDGLLRIERVPFELRQVSPELKRRFGPVDKEYKMLTFHKEDLKRHAEAELMGPGHPLFEAVVDRVLSLYGVDVRSGAAFYDPDRKKESVVAFFRVPVHDGRGIIVGERLVALEVSSDSEPTRVNPSLLLDCKPADFAGCSSSNPVQVEESSLLQWGYDRIFRPYLDEMQARRSRDLALAKKHVEISLNSLIAESQHKLMKYKRQLSQGQDMTMAIRQEETRKRDLEERLQRRMKEIELEKNLSLGRPELVGMALLLPMPREGEAAEMARDEEVEAAAMDFVLNHEKMAGRNPIDVSNENLGFDVRSESPDGQIRYIEVKGRAAVGGVWLTPNEWQMAGRFGSNYWLYVVFHAKSSPKLKLIQDPVRSLPVIEEKEIVRYIVSVDSIEKAAQEGENYGQD